MAQHRQLAAILVTDIEGYTAIMQQSEQQAVVLRDQHRATLQRITLGCLWCGSIS
jgi:class 3 adenylate cyclase